MLPTKQQVSSQSSAFIILINSEHHPNYIFVHYKTFSGYSGADMSTLCKEAALSLVRGLISRGGNPKDISSNDLPPLGRSHFELALKRVKASVGSSDLGSYEEWDKKYGATRDTYGFAQDDDQP